MPKRFAMLALAAFALSGCPGPTVTNNTIVPVVTPTPTPWLSQEPLCSGAITRAEWLVCDNTTLRDLHRRLAAQWESARHSASTDRIALLENQLYALLSELDLCQEVACVDKAYRRYLDSPPPQPKPTATAKPKPKPKAKPKRPWTQRPWRDGLQNCAQDAGWDEANRLSQRCKAVTWGSNSVCSPQRSCASLENLVDKGCRTSRNPPDFCPR